MLVSAATHALPQEVAMAGERTGGNTGGIGLGGILVIVGIVLMIVWSFWIGLIIALIGLIAFGGVARGEGELALPGRSRLGVAQPRRPDVELHALLARLAPRVALLPDVLLGERVDVLVAAAGLDGLALDLDVLIRVALVEHDQRGSRVALEVARPGAAAGAVDGDVAVL